jgi:hypothetical protein
MIEPRALTKTEVFKRWKQEIAPLLNEVITRINGDWTEDDVEISINKNESVVFIVETNNAIKGLIVLTPRESFDTLELHCWACVVKPPLKLTDYWDWIRFQANCLGAKKITLETNRAMGRKFKFLKEVYTKYEVRV